MNNTTVIVSGGNPINDCPRDWEEAKALEVKLNSEESDRPQWKFDCGYKLDYDGDILVALSRFYPPKDFYGDTWDGKVTIYLLGKVVETKSFDCPTIEVLQSEVEEYIKSVELKIANLFDVNLE